MERSGSATHLQGDQASFFEQRGFVVVPGFCSSEMAGLLAESLLLERDVQVFETGDYHRDSRIPKAFSIFGKFDYCLTYFLPVVKQLTANPSVIPMNSYARIYGCGSSLTRHVDAPELHYTVSLCLQPDKKVWSFGICDLLGEEHAVVQSPGDAILFHRSLPHWRNGAFSGESHSQLFLHYTDGRDPEMVKKKFRGRPMLGVKLTQGNGQRSLVSRLAGILIRVVMSRGRGLNHKITQT